MRARAVAGSALVLVLIAAAVMRGTNLGWGLEAGFVFPDERIWSLSTSRFAHLSLAPFVEWPLFPYPPLYGYVIALAAHAVAFIGLAPPIDGGMGDTILLVARAVSAVAATVTVAVIAALGRSMYGVWPGILAAALLAGTPMAVMQVRYASVESLLVLWMTVAVAASWRLLRTGGIGPASVAGAIVALAFSTKYTGLAAISVVGWAIVERAWATRSVREVGRLVVAAMVGAAIAIAVACPPCVLTPETLWAAMEKHRALTTLALFPNNHLSPTVGWWSRPWLHYLVATLPYALGVPLAVFSLSGTARALVKRRPADRLLLAAITPYFLFIGGASVVFPRYLLPIAPPLALLAGALVATIRWRPAAIAVGTMATAYGWALSASHVESFSGKQQQEVGQWFAGQARAGNPERRIGLPLVCCDYFGVQRPLRRAGYELMSAEPGHWLDAYPPYLVIPEWYAIAVRRDEQLAAARADLAALESGTAGYRVVHRIPMPRHLQYALDTRLDPAYAGDLWQGSIGFTIYARLDIAVASPRRLAPHVPRKE